MLTGGRILAVIGLSLGLAVAALALMPGRPEATVLPASAAPPPQQQATQTVRVLAAAVQIEAGANVAPGDLVALELPVGTASAFLADTPDHRAALAGQPAARALPAGSPLLPADLPQPAKAAQPLLAPGMRAIAVPVSAETGVAGLIGIGDRVDVLLASRQPDGSPAVRILLHNARIVAVDRSTEAVAAAAAPGPAARTVTLELTPEAAKVLTLAGQLGSLSLALTGDPEGQGPLLAQDAPLLAADLTGSVPEPVPELVAIVPAAAPPKPRVVEIVRGGSVSAQTVVRTEQAAAAAPVQPREGRKE